MTRVRSLTSAAALLALASVVRTAPQSPPPATPTTAAAPQRDPVAVRGCLDQRWLRIVRHDASDLSGVTRVRLKGARAMLALVDDGRGDYVEITGDLDTGARDRLETRRKRKVGSKTTLSFGASAEQTRGTPVAAGSEPSLTIVTFVRLGERCPLH